MDINKIAELLNFYQHGFNIIDWCGTEPKPVRWYPHYEEIVVLQVNRPMEGQDNWRNLPGAMSISLNRDVAKAIVNLYRFRWIKLSEATQDELPFERERIEILTEDSQSRQAGMYNPSIATYMKENNGHSFYPMFTWAVVECFIDNPEAAKRIYADKTYISVKNVIYFRHINREDLPEYIPRERRSYDS